MATRALPFGLTHTIEERVKLDPDHTHPPDPYTTASPVWVAYEHLYRLNVDQCRIRLHNLQTAYPRRNFRLVSNVRTLVTSAKLTAALIEATVEEAARLATKRTPGTPYRNRNQPQE